MTAVDLIASALPPETPPEPPEEGVCCVTGATGPTISRKHVLKPSFTQLDLLKEPSSTRAGVAAWRALTFKWERMSSWACNGQSFVRLDRKGVREHVLIRDESTIPCAYYATTSYKKHGALLAPANPPCRRVWLFETVLVDCSDMAAVTDMWSRMRRAQDQGIPRPLIETLDIAPSYMAKVGWRVWRDFYGWARPRVHSPLYRFISYLLPSQKELRDEAD